MKLFSANKVNCKEEMNTKHKIIVIGCPGSGKSTFSKALADRTGLPLHHLDNMNWNSDWTCVPKELFKERLFNVLKEEKWIIDGNYGSTIEDRLKVCDLVFFLDYPTEVCLEGVKSRMGKARSDMPCVEQKEDAEFMDFIAGFEKESKPKILELLSKYQEKKVITFISRAQANEFLKEL